MFQDGTTYLRQALERLVVTIENETEITPVVALALAEAYLAVAIPPANAEQVEQYLVGRGWVSQAHPNPHLWVWLHSAYRDGIDGLLALVLARPERSDYGRFLRAGLHASACHPGRTRYSGAPGRHQGDVA